MSEHSTPPPARRAVWALLAALALAHAGLAIWFAASTPYRTPGILRSFRGTPAADIGAPDERQHVNYVARLLRGQGLPVFDPKDPNLYENYQSHQPPLYYVLAAGWFRLLGGGDPLAPEAGLALRSLNALFGAATVFGVFFLGRWGYRRAELGLIAAAVAAFLPMNVALSGAANNDSLLIALCTWALAVAALAARDGWTPRRAAGLGLLVGLALLTKTTAVALFPAVLVAIAARRAWRVGAIALAVPLIVAAPWWARNEALYGDPLAMRAFGQAFVGSAQASPFIESFGLAGYLIHWVGWWTARSFFGAFGYMDIWLNESGVALGAGPNTLYRLLVAGGALLFLGWLAATARGEWKESRGVQWTNGVFLLAILFLFLRFNLQYFQGQARYVLPAIGPISIGFAIGALHWARGRWLPVFVGFVALFGGLCVWAGLRLPAEFARRTGPDVGRDDSGPVTRRWSMASNERAWCRH